MSDVTPILPGLSPVAGKSVVARFDGGRLSSDGGLLLVREVEHRLRVAERLAACIKDPRAPDQVTHSLADIIRFRLLMISAGYEDGNDASSLRSDPMFKMALDLAPSDRELCSQSTISRLENLPDTRTLLRMGRALVDLYCGSFQQVPKRIVLDIDDTFDAVHGGQQLCLFNAHYDEYGFQPIVVFDGQGRFITCVLRPAKRPSGKEIKPFLRRLLRAIRSHWPRTEILLRGDSHYCGPQVLDWCRANGVDYILGVAPTPTLRRHILDLEASTKAIFEAAPGQDKARRFKSFHDGAASWSRVERIIARVEVGDEGPDTRFIVTNLTNGNPRTLYETVYCRRGQAENHIKSWKTHLAADRTSCTKATANQFRLFLHAGAYWLMWGLRLSMPKRSMWRVAQFDTLRLGSSRSPPASSK
jgi:Transposase DDE domain group 1